MELRRLRTDGKRAAVVFVMQRDDARLFAPHWDSDTAFAEMLCEVADHEVEVYAYGCQVKQQEITMGSPVPVALSRSQSSGHEPSSGFQ